MAREVRRQPFRLPGVPIALAIARGVTQVRLRHSSIFRLGVRLGEARFDMGIVSGPSVVTVKIVRASVARGVSPRFGVSYDFVLGVVP